VVTPPGILLEKNIDEGGTFAWGKRVRPSVMRTFVQRVRAGGTFVFADTGIQVSAVDSGENVTGAIITSLHDSKVFVNAEYGARNGILGQRLDSLGERLWNTADVIFNLPAFTEFNAVIDGNGGCIVVGFHQFDFSVRAVQVSRYGNLGEVITSVNGGRLVGRADGFILYQNYPNPFNARTLIRFDVPRSTPITLEIFNPLGQRVRKLVDGHYQAGSYQVPFEAVDMASGIYLYRLRTPESLQVRKLIIIK